MIGRAMVSPVHLLDSTNPGDLPTPTVIGVSQEEEEDDDDKEGISLESGTEVQTCQSEGRAPLDADTNTPSSSLTATNTPLGSHTATPKSSDSRTATPT